ncbi:MAG: hypothetical protein A3C14_06010 [Candidatus Lloydbacteria bacterium RIFCSPHIGHO2_02_FULL_50_18]|nr:MAG: hypothetical protein A3C14_06010 [Candidatus Lloydbacteria bacterium RIFCSPHIGHO2_02_FULL_50_18]
MNLDFLFADQKYLTVMSVDPAGGVADTEYAGYYVWVSSNNRITACAPRAELGADISVTR